jgi:hypothetical protein
MALPEAVKGTQFASQSALKDLTVPQKMITDPTLHLEARLVVADLRFELNVHLDNGSEIPRC